MPPAVAAPLIAGLGAFAVSLGAGGLALAALAGLKVFAVTLLLSEASKRFLTQKLQSPGQFTASPRERLQMIRSAVEPHRYIYGEALVSGVWVYAETTGANDEYMHVVVVLAAHEVEQIGDIYFDDVKVGTLDGSGNVTSGKFSGLARIKKHLGTAAQAADSDLVADSGGQWTTNHKLSGRAYLYVRLKRDDDAFPGGLPQMRALVKGKKLYDPRTATTIYSNNWALAIRDYVSGSHGLGAASSEIDDTAMVTAANVADERVTVTYASPAFTLDAATDLLNFASTQNRLGTGDAVKISTTGSLSGTGLSTGTVYYYIRSSSSSGKLATTRANALAGTAINITGAGSGTHTLTPAPVGTLSASADTFTFETEETWIATGDGVQIETSGSLSGTGLAVSTTYYAVRTGSDTIQLATSYANALAGTVINITGAGAGTHNARHIDQARYTVNGTISLADTPRAILDTLIASGAGAMTFTAGLYTLFAGAYVTPTVTLTVDDLRGPVERTRDPRRGDLYNTVRGTYVEPARFWQETNFPEVSDSTYVSNDNGDTIAEEFNFPLTTDPLRAQRAAKIALNQHRRGNLSLPCKLNAMKLATMETVMVTISALSFSSKVFRVLGWELAADNNGLGVNLSLREDVSTDYDWASSDADYTSDSRALTVPDPLTIGAPVGIGSPLELACSSGTAQLLKASDGTIISRIYVQWGAAVEPNIWRYELQWKQSAESDYSSAVFPSDQLAAFISGVQDGATYNVRVRTIAKGGARSAFLSTSHVVIGKTEAPSAPGNLAAEAVIDGIRLTWDSAGDVDIYGTEIWEGQDAAFTGSPSAVKIDIAFGDSYRRRGLAAGVTRWYKVRHVDTSGNPSDWATLAGSPDTGSVGATAGLVDTIDVQANAITVPSSAYTDSSTPGTAAYKEVQRVSMDLSGGAPVYLNFGAQFNWATTGGQYMTAVCALYRGIPVAGSPDLDLTLLFSGQQNQANTKNGTTYSYANQANWFFTDDSPPAGSVTYVLQIAALDETSSFISIDSYSRRAIFALETKR